MINKSVFVTGATGFLGKKLCLELRDGGFFVTAIGRNEKIGKELLAQEISFAAADITDFEAMKKLSKNHQFVIHCAALSSPWGKYRDFYDANVVGTQSIVDACLANKIERLVHISTPSIYFDFSNRSNVCESDPLPKKMVNHYAQTKLLAEQVVDKAYAQGLETLILRPRGIFGPGDTALLPRLVKVNQEMGVPLIDGGKQLVDMTYVDNVIEASILALTSSKNSLGKKYNITNGEPIALVELFTELFAQIKIPLRFKPIKFAIARSYAAVLEFVAKTFLCGKEPSLTQYSVGVLGKGMTLNIDEAKKYLNYSPKITLREGIIRYAKWWRENNHD
jgi:nucleoside-diphosphate-sugar epimerase